MQIPSLPLDEARRLTALHATRLLHSQPDDAFDRITRMASRLLKMPMATVSLVDKDIQWFKSRCGIDVDRTGRDVSFCAHAILDHEPLVVPDAALDARFADNPLVTGPPHVRFYAGVQLYSIDRMPLGTLCVLDRVPRHLSEDELDILRDLARMAEQLIHHRQLASAAQSLHSHVYVEPGASGELSAAAGQVEFLLNHDALTGLANRQSLVRTIEQNLGNWGKASIQTLVATINIDKFKRLNELLGHHAGDKALVAVTWSLQSLLRPGDTLARAGNDEFVLLLPGLGDDAVARDRLRQLMQAVNREFKSGGGTVPLTCSIGYAIFPQDGGNGDVLLNHATMATRRAKELGGGQIQRFSDELHRAVQRKLTLETQLRQAIVNDQLYLVYQPKIGLRDGAVAGLEVLLRWQHPEHGTISPVEFIPIAEDSGLIVEIGEWVLRGAVAQAGAWRAAGVPPVPVAVNLSARQFLRTDIVATVAGVVRDAALPPGALELELTESMSIDDPQRSSALMHQLRELGIALSIDDFGTGYSSLSYLKRLPVDKLKIDRSFVLDVHQSAESLAMVQAIIAMAHSLHLEVIAEGVDKAEQYQALRAAGCDQIQGFYFSPPLEAQACAEYLRLHGTQADGLSAS
ncbi:EAL domain-containing protein [Massilia sp. YIM B02763]|uniref:putative bifunctional diguanylate cyclase/phosphodiesterase n=1 Tax=Massilia sp. YIM B02763 TaxID=3050130 RepID=UPI0025B70B62|nr:EAL domain-containing protein [Massilia sp. YIM B02763]MDN4055619.1 EAL domain-containing protein [Massilia sp. YIM B02763]